VIEPPLEMDGSASQTLGFLADVRSWLQDRPPVPAAVAGAGCGFGRRLRKPA